MSLVLFRIFALALLAHAGYVYTPFPGRPLAGLVLGALAALSLITLELKLRSVPGHHMVTPATRAALVTVYAPSSFNESRLMEILKETETTLTRFCGGAGRDRRVVR